jgi:hypothetical protein
MDERIENARRLYERAVFAGDTAALAEAGDLAAASGAHRILRSVEEARAAIAG